MKAITRREARHLPRHGCGNKMKRYNLVIPKTLYDAVKKLAEKEGISVVAIFRRFIKLGLLVTKMRADGNDFFFREADGTVLKLEIL